MGPTELLLISHISYGPSNWSIILNLTRCWSLIVGYVEIYKWNIIFMIMFLVLNIYKGIWSPPPV